MCLIGVSRRSNPSEHRHHSITCGKLSFPRMVIDDVVLCPKCYPVGGYTSANSIHTGGIPTYYPSLFSLFSLSLSLGLCIELWKVTKVVQINVDSENLIAGVIPRISFVDRPSYESSTKEYDMVRKNSCLELYRCVYWQLMIVKVGSRLLKQAGYPPSS